MNKRIKQKWIKALLSGEYKQGKGRLKTSKGNYCCLGVLCAIAPKRFQNIWKGTDLDLPCMIVEWAGLKSRNPHIRDEGASLSFLNDQGNNFDKIAEIIREHL